MKNCRVWTKRRTRCPLEVFSSGEKGGFLFTQRVFYLILCLIFSRKINFLSMIFVTFLMHQIKNLVESTRGIRRSRRTAKSIDGINEVPSCWMIKNLTRNIRLRSKYWKQRPFSNWKHVKIISTKDSIYRTLNWNKIVEKLFDMVHKSIAWGPTRTQHAEISKGLWIV